MGFEINRTMEQIQEIFNKKGNQETGIIEKSGRRPKDYAGGAHPRAGVTARPLTDIDMIRQVAVMHQGGGDSKAFIFFGPLFDPLFGPFFGPLFVLLNQD